MDVLAQINIQTLIAQLLIWILKMLYILMSITGFRDHTLCEKIIVIYSNNRGKKHCTLKYLNKSLDVKWTQKVVSILARLELDQASKARPVFPLDFQRNPIVLSSLFTVAGLKHIWRNGETLKLLDVLQCFCIKSFFLFLRHEIS